MIIQVDVGCIAQIRDYPHFLTPSLSTFAMLSLLVKRFVVLSKMTDFFSFAPNVLRATYK